MLAGHDSDYIRVLWLVASAFGVAAVVALALLYRRAIRRAELEVAERVIAEHDHSDDSP